jgi:beta-lactam-binding protein with PASTA domain
VAKKDRAAAQLQYTEGKMEAMVTNKAEFTASQKPELWRQRPSTQTCGRRHSARNTPGFGTVAVVVLLMTLAACSKKVQVPDVKGTTADKAGQTLASAQLKVGKISCKQGDILPTAKVLSQTPSAGEAVASNTGVDLLVEDSISVPKLVDTGAADALLGLQNAGLKAALNKKPELLHWGTVVHQDIAPGTMVSPDTIVTLTVATPPDMGMFQDLITKQPAYARLNQKERDLMAELFK